MTLSVNPTASDIWGNLRAFLQFILDPSVEVVLGQENWVPEPGASPNLDFVVFTPVRRERLATNIDNEHDVVFTAAMNRQVMTVTALRAISGPIKSQAQLFGVGVVANTKVTRQISGTPGGIGNYGIQPPQVLSSRTISAGARTMLEKWLVVIQIDVHGPNSEDNATIISTAMRDTYAVDFFNNLNADIIPIHADDPKQIPFINAEKNWEDRWIIEAHMQTNQTVAVPQQYADKVVLTLENVDATFPP